MSVRGAEGAGSAGAETEERRAGVGQRVHFEALVAVGEAQGGGGFEAESVDVSLDGMRLRTAYLPEVGDRLVCRFDGQGIEVVTEGEVLWRNEASRGGEFGLRFVGLEGQAAEAVRAMCSSLGETPGEPAPAEATVTRGTRVRLHIDGLGSPMKARVREAAGQQMEVGSNLEFLRVGRDLEVEDVDRGARRKASIDTVKVEVDPATNVPQLVVTLRYDGAPGAKDAAPASVGVTRRSRGGSAIAPAAGRAAVAVAAAAGVAGVVATREAQAHPAEPREPEVDADHDAGEPRADGAFGGLAGKLGGVGRAGRAVAGALGPRLAGVGSRAKGAMNGIVASIQRKRAERMEAQRAGAPRRTTASAPGGALKSEGRRLVRDEAVEEEAPPAPRLNKRAAALGSLLGLAAVLAVFAVTRFVSARAPTATAALPAPGTTQAAELAASSPGTPTANVPLFGATPLSTTEAVPPPAPSAAPSAVAATTPPDGNDEAHPAGQGGKEWGQGPVKNPVVLKIKMDAPIEHINGASGAMGFTLTLPDRRSVGSASELARKDKRIASVTVVNTSHGAEVSVQFKDGVPPYLARAHGDRLEIALGREAHGKVAKKKGKKKSKK